jgi:hypothetical protein
MNASHMAVLAARLLDHAKDAMAKAPEDPGDPDHGPMVTAALVFSGLGEAIATTGAEMALEERRRIEEIGQEVRRRVRGILKEDG